MPKKTVIKLPPLNLGEETIGKRIARLRKKKGLTQTELAKKIGTIQRLVSDYELGRIRLYDEMVARFAIALDTTTDYIIGLAKNNVNYEDSFFLKFIPRIKEIESLSEDKIDIILKDLDNSIMANR